MKIPLKKIEPNPFQPRMEFDKKAIKALAASIEDIGLLQPIVVRRIYPEGTQPHAIKKEADKTNEVFQIAVGENRYRAHQLLWKEGKIEDSAIEGNIKPLDDRQMFEAAIQENIQRQDLSAIELARAMMTAKSQFGMTSPEVAKLFDASASTVRGMIRILDLPETITTRLNEGVITLGATRPLLTAQRMLGPDIIKSLFKDKPCHDSTNPLGIHQVTRWAWGKVRWHDDTTLIPKESASFEYWHASWEIDKRALKLLKPVKAQTVLDYWPELDDKELTKEHDCSSAKQMIVKAFEDYENTDLEPIKHLMKPPTCTKCPYHGIIDGDHLCVKKICAERKEVLANYLSKEKDLRRLKRTGIPLITKEDQVEFETRSLKAYEWVAGENGSERVPCEESRKRIKEGDPSLRIADKPYMDENDLTKSRWVEYVELIPRKIPLKTDDQGELIEIEEDPDYTTEAIDWAWEQATPTLKDIFKEIKPAARIAILESTGLDYYMRDPDLDDGDSEENMSARILVWSIIMDQAFDWEKGPVEVSKQIKRLSKRLDFTPKTDLLKEAKAWWKERNK